MKNSYMSACSFKSLHTAYLLGVGGSLSIGLAVASAQAVGKIATPEAPGATHGRSIDGKPNASQIGLSRSIPLYRAHCLECHDADGRGESARETMGRIPDFTEPKWHVMRRDQELARVIYEGKGFMPAMKNKLVATDVEPMVRLVRSFRGGGLMVPEGDEDKTETPIPAAHNPSVSLTQTGARSPRSLGSPPSGPEGGPSSSIRGIYQRLCVSCHGTDGSGNIVRASMPSIPNFSVRAWQEQQSDVQLMTSVLEGKGTEMPAFNTKLTEIQARELVTYIRSYAGSWSQGTLQPRNDFEQDFEQLMSEMTDLKKRSRALTPQSPDSIRRLEKRGSSEGSLKQNKRKE
jgi:mono/diheme cytochrome c family protein